MQRAAEYDVQDVVAHGIDMSAADCVRSILPKLRPVTVTGAEPHIGPFVSTSDATGESKLRTSIAVPDTAATVIAAYLTADIKVPLDRQLIVVLLDQLAVAHCAMPTAAVAVKSMAAKLRPDTVTDAPPLCGAF